LDNLEKSWAAEKTSFPRKIRVFGKKFAKMLENNLKWSTFKIENSKKSWGGVWNRPKSNLGYGKPSGFSLLKIRFSGQKPVF